MSSMSIDLHTHSSASDGALSPLELVREAAQLGISVLGLTDHDTLAGIPAAQEEARIVKIELVPGIEFSTEVGVSEIHILGYYVQESKVVNDLLLLLKNVRLERIILMIKKLNQLGIDLNPEDVLESSKNGVYGRPQVALALMRKGIVGTVEEAFQKYLAYGRPAYVPHYKLSPWEAISLIREAQGIPIYAHPGVSQRDDLIPSFAKAGLAGLEVFYPQHNEAQTERYLNIANSLSLLVTGGSDFHGEGKSSSTLGYPDLPQKYYEKFKKFALHLDVHKALG